MRRVNFRFWLARTHNLTVISIFLQGVALSARNMVANMLQVDHMEDLGVHSLGLLPFFHIYGMLLIHLSIYQGTAKVVLPRFDPHTLLKVLAKYKVRCAPDLFLFYAMPVSHANTGVKFAS